MGYGYGKTTNHYNYTATRYADSARVKTTFDNRMCAHVWAQQVQDFGKSANGNLYFEDSIIYSYGRHFPLAIICKSGRIFMNGDFYGITTSGHQSDVRSAIHGRDYFQIPDLGSIVYALRDSRNSDGPAVRNYVSQHVLTIDTEAARALLLESGELKSKIEKQILAYRKAATATAEKKKAAELKQEIAGHLRHAKTLAELTESDWQAHKKQMLDRLYWQSARRDEPGKFSGTSTGFNGECLKHQKAATAKGWTRITQIVAARRKDWLATLKRAARLRELADKNAYLKQDIARFRHAMAELAAGQKLTRANDYQSFIKSIETIWTHVKLKEDSAQKLRALKAFARFEFTQKLAAENAEHERERAQRAAARFAKEEANRAAWLAGQSVPGYRGTDESGRALVRAVRVQRDNSGQIIDGVLETSQGADVPLLHALRAFSFVKLCHDTGRNWQANGRTIRVGHFKIDSVSPDGFRAGCHSIGWQECERLARELSVLDIPASDSALEPSH